MIRTLKIAVCGTLIWAQGSIASACPLCKYALETNDAEPTAYMVSILFMMGTIGTLFMSVAALLWWVTKLEKKKLMEAGYEHLFENAGCQPHLVKVDPNV